MQKFKVLNLFNHLSDGINFNENFMNVIQKVEHLEIDFGILLVFNFKLGN